MEGNLRSVEEDVGEDASLRLVETRMGPSLNDELLSNLGGSDARETMPLGRWDRVGEIIWDGADRFGKSTEPAPERVSIGGREPFERISERERMGRSVTLVEEEPCEATSLLLQNHPVAREPRGEVDGGNVERESALLCNGSKDGLGGWPVNDGTALPKEKRVEPIIGPEVKTMGLSGANGSKGVAPGNL